MSKAVVLTLVLLVAAVQGVSMERADSLAMAGAAGQAEEELLSLLRGGSADREVLLFRLCGLLHGSGRESECILLLDSLETALGLDLTGWKVSVLDLGRRPGEALALVRNDALLHLWISRDLDEPVPSSPLPAPDDIAERAIRAMQCPAGAMTISQIDRTVLDSAVLPFLADEVCDELEAVLETAGPWWDEVAEELRISSAPERLEQLLVLRREHLSMGTESDWTPLLEVGDARSAAAASMLIRIAPEVWSRSWSVTDALTENGRALVAESLAVVSGDSLFVLGVEMALLRERSRFGELLALCESMPGTVPDSLAARTLLFRARALRANGRPASVYYPAYLDLALAHPWHPKASEAAYLAAKYFDGQRDWPAAADAYLAALSSGSYGGSLAYWRGGFCHYMCGRGNVGDSLWSVGISEFPYSVWSDEMLFWRARYANRTGDPVSERSLLEETAEAHPWEFYGMLAAERLGGDIPSGFPAPVIDLSGGEDILSAAVGMYSRGYGSMASTMLSTTSIGDPGLRGAALALMGEHSRSLTLLRRWDTELRGSGEGMLPDSLLSFYFPAPYRELTEELTADLSVPSAAVTGLMRQESYFHRWARSHVGASGLIQLMPGTAGDISRWYGLPQLSGDEFYVPTNSIRYGAIYLDRQFGSFDGSLPLALAAYNAGPGNASRWMDDFPMEPGDPELFIEQITLVETRRYVKLVLANTQLYERASR